MSRSDIFDDQLRSWLQEHAEAEIPTSIRGRARRVTAGRRSRPGAFATIGSHWLAGAPSDTRYALRPVLALIAVLAALALIGTALLVAAQRPEPEPPPDGAGRLLYDRDGDIVLADADGTGARVLLDGAPSTDPSGAYFTLLPEVWAPDGEHFVYFEYGPTGVITHVADATGRTAGTWTNPPPSDRAVRPPRLPIRDTKATNVQTWWSPDSKMLATFPWTATEIPIHGIDGRVVTSLPLPSGYEMFREFGLSGWTPDGDSVLAIITSRAIGLRPEVWQLALDGSPPRPVLDGDAFAGAWNVSPDGRRVAFTGHVNLDGSQRFGAGPVEGADTIYIADIDGGNQRPLPGTTHSAGVRGPVLWSPDGSRILYTSGGHGYRYDLNVIDVSTGNETPVAKVLSDAWAPHVWSPDGETILIGAFAVEPGIDGPQPSQLGPGRSLPNRESLVSLWRANVDGTEVEVVAGGLNGFDVTP